MCLKRSLEAMNPLEQELQMVVNHHVGVGSESMFYEEQQVFLSDLSSPSFSLIKISSRPDISFYLVEFTNKGQRAQKHK